MKAQLTLRSHPRRGAQLAVCVLLLACRDPRERSQPRPVYEGDVASLLEARCERCHGAGDAGSGYRVDGYARLLGCPDGMPETAAVQPSDAGAPILDALKSETHEGLLESSERERLREFVLAGVPLRDHGVHASGISNPRSSDWHGRLAAQDRFGPLREPDHPEACGRCHAGAPVRPKDATRPAASAPACTSCHDRPGGVLACGTCHGDGGERAYPPRERCAFDGPEHDAHRVHGESTRLRSEPLVCDACHPAAGGDLSGTHGDGTVDVRFDPELAGVDAAFDCETRRCAVSCHDRGGARAQPRFHEAGPLGCGDCHGAPPEGHYAGDCDGCHVEVNATGSSLRDTRLHGNGRVDVGDGSPRCGQCHGTGDDPMPATGAHRLHRETKLAAPVACSECHVMPRAVTSLGHLDVGEPSAADVVFGPRARARGRLPRYEAGACREIACHGAGLEDGIERALRWDASSPQLCSGCHGLPPGGSHPQDDNCASVLCHGGQVRLSSTGPQITESGRARHVDGVIDLASRQ
jgi:predicted CxxxxCH...CXXCH cytochrome family protein